MEVRFETGSQFNGSVFVENHVDDPECKVFSNFTPNNVGDSRTVTIRLKFKSCGLKRERSVGIIS